MKLFGAIIPALLIGLSVAVSIMLHPIFYIAWLIYNRRNIALWLGLLVVLLSGVLPFQYYSFLSEILPRDIWNPAKNPFILYGLFLSLPFLIVRMAAGMKFSTNKRRYYMATFLFILQLIWLLIPIIPIHYAMASSYPVMQFIRMEVGALLWVSLMSFMFIRYPEDILVRQLYQYILNIHNEIRDGRAGEK